MALGKGVNMDRISLESAVNILKDYKVKLQNEKVTLLNALGRVLAVDVVAKHNQPPFDRSPLDGYAIRGEDTIGATKDTPIKLQVIDEVCAGHQSSKVIETGQSIRIMTGASIPEGSNAVIKQEDTDEGVNIVNIYQEIKPNQNYCYAGEDYKEGETLIVAGELLTAAHIGLLASNGINEVIVLRKLRVGLMSTGDELIEPFEPIVPGKIYNSNIYTLTARLIELGCEPVVIGTIHDNVTKGVSLIQEYTNEVDIIITTGGVSVGKMDIMHPIFHNLNIKPLFWRLKLKPGTPALAGNYNNTLLLCLSGNPSAAAITFELLFRPLLSEITNCNKLNLKRATGKMGENFPKKSPIRRFIKAYIEDGKVYLTKGNHSSGALKSMIGCNCFIDVNVDSKLEIGQQVNIVLI